jgi:hypothetical protein
MKDRTGKDTLSLLLIMWLHTVNPLYIRLSKNIIREIGAYYAQDLLPCLIKGKLVVYNVRTGVEIASRSSFFEVAVFCLAGRETAICFKALESNVVQELNLLTCLLSELPNMIETRRSPEVIHIAGITYVFGGLLEYKYIRSCEQYNRKEANWTYLPSLNAPRHSAWPCEYAREIYLPPVYFFENVEVFSISTRSIRTVSPSITPACSWVISVSLVIRGELVIMTTEGEMARWMMKGEQSSFQVSKLSTKVAKVSCAPVKCAREMVWFESGYLMRLNCDTYALEKASVSVPE